MRILLQCCLCWQRIIDNVGVPHCGQEGVGKMQWIHTSV